jgi:type II secretory pathway pseudopilin PulG
MHFFSRFHASRSPQLPRGFGLLEVILVFAIVIGAAAVIFTVFSSAGAAADADTETNDAQVIAANLKGMYGEHPKYDGLTRTVAIQTKAIPQKMITGTTTAMSLWGPIDVYQAAAYLPQQEFAIGFSNVPSSVCLKFVLGIAPYFPDGLSLSPGFGSPTVVPDPTLMTNGKVNIANVTSGCSSNQNSVYMFGH